MNNTTEPLHFEGKKNTRRATVEVDGYSVQIEVTLWGYNREDARKARVSVSGQEDVDYTDAYKMAEGDVKDAVFKVLNRKEVANMKVAISEAREVLPTLEAILAGHKLTFSRTAGCSCGCSPAFVPDSHLSVTGTYTEYNGNVVTANLKVRNLWITKKAQA